jgi:hypothetical protein
VTGVQQLLLRLKEYGHSPRTEYDLDAKVGTLKVVLHLQEEEEDDNHNQAGPSTRGSTSNQLSSNMGNDALSEIRDMFKVLTQNSLRREEQTNDRTMEGMQTPIRKAEAAESWPDRTLQRQKLQHEYMSSSPLVGSCIWFERRNRRMNVTTC